jgi:hypothetical protein
VSSVQIITSIAFWLFLIASLTIIGTQGHKAGRLFVALLVIATVATFLANSAFGNKAAQPAVFAIDFGLLVCVASVAMSTAVHWPLWFAGFHSVTVATGLAHLAFPIDIPEIYIDASGFWALPALGAAVAGVLLDRRAQLPG